MTDHDNSSWNKNHIEPSASVEKASPGTPGRRRVLAGIGALAAASAAPHGVFAQSNANDTDVLIIGGGIAGASTAFHLAEQGRDVILLERGEIASEACLLYTSPSPRDQRGSRMPSSA